jgi:hypothetical protein
LKRKIRAEKARRRVPTEDEGPREKAPLTLEVIVRRRREIGKGRRQPDLSMEREK